MDRSGFPPRRFNPPQFSWSAPAPTPAAIDALIARFPEVLVIPDSAIDAEFLEWSAQGIIGRSLGSWVSPDAVAREIRRLPGAGEARVIPLACRCYLVKLCSPEARDVVLANPLSVNGSAFALAEWRPDFLPADDAIPSALLWLRLPGLPIEYWGDEALRLIVAPAGEFVCADQCTLDCQRGGFARVCIRTRIDLPLRPGVRVQGRNSLFWQQFAFENLPGIFPCCGSLHLSGPCMAPSSAGSPAADLCFGPWMAALRLRTAAAQPRGPPPVSGPSTAPAPASSAADGWTIPKKFARRRAGAGSSPASGHSPGMAPADVASSSSGKATALVAQSSSALPVAFSAPFPQVASPSAVVGGVPLAKGRKGSRCSRGGKVLLAPPPVPARPAVAVGNQPVPARSPASRGASLVPALSSVVPGPQSVPARLLIEGVNVDGCRDCLHRDVRVQSSVLGSGGCGSGDRPSSGNGGGSDSDDSNPGPAKRARDDVLPLPGTGLCQPDGAASALVRFGDFSEAHPSDLMVSQGSGTHVALVSSLRQAISRTVAVPRVTEAPVPMDESGVVRGASAPSSD